MIESGRMLQAISMVRHAKRVYLFGNGGSAANALHIANDLVSVGVGASALVADISTLTAIANDHGYENVFARQLQLFADKDDLVIALSGSGESKNIIRALNKAKAKSVPSIAVVGAWQGGVPKAVHLSTLAIRVGDNMQQAEEAQLVFGHNLYRAFHARGVEL
jgi:D-sedoheptulose 7-phosphate isomerase